MLDQQLALEGAVPPSCINYHYYFCVEWPTVLLQECLLRNLPFGLYS